MQEWDTDDETRKFVVKMGAIGLLSVLEEVVRTRHNYANLSEVFRREEWVLGDQV